MNHETQKQWDLKALAEGVETRPAPERCQKIAELLSALPPSGSLSTPSPTSEQKKAFEMLKEILREPTSEELRFMAEIYCAKYHRIRRDGDLRCWMPQRAEELYQSYYEQTGSEEVKYILDHFDAFCDLCGKRLSRRQRADDFALYYQDTPLSTSPHPDSSEWKG